MLDRLIWWLALPMLKIPEYHRWHERKWLVEERLIQHWKDGEIDDLIVFKDAPRPIRCRIIVYLAILDRKLHGVHPR